MAASLEGRTPDRRRSPTQPAARSEPGAGVRAGHRGGGPGRLALDRPGRQERRGPRGGRRHAPDGRHRADGWRGRDRRGREGRGAHALQQRGIGDGRAPRWTSPSTTRGDPPHRAGDAGLRSRWWRSPSADRCSSRGAAVYMDKIAGGPEAAGALDIEASPGENVRASRRQGRPEDVTVVVLDRDRHEGLIAELRESGAKVYLSATATWLLHRRGPGRLGRRPADGGGGHARGRDLGGGAELSGRRAAGKVCGRATTTSGSAGGRGLRGRRVLTTTSSSRATTCSSRPPGSPAVRCSAASASSAAGSRPSRS